MDLNDLIVKDDAQALHLTHPVTGDPLMNGDKPVLVYVRPGSHPEVRKVDRKIGDKRIRDVQRNRGKVEFTAESSYEEGTMRLAAHVEKWENLEMNGAPVPCTEETKLSLLGNPGLDWFRTQIDQFAGGVANFLPSASKPLKAGAGSTSPSAKSETA